MSIELVNKVSEDILKNNDNIADIKAEVKIYAELFDNTLRNAYEVLTMLDECPLFVLLYTLEQGKGNFCMDDEEFLIYTDKLKSILRLKFGVVFSDIRGVK